jgi:transposase
MPTTLRHAALRETHGLSLHEVGQRIGCAAVSVMRWRDARRRGGEQALKVLFSPGRPWKLNQAERKRLVRRLLKGSLAYGYRTNRWTTARAPLPQAYRPETSDGSNIAAADAKSGSA